MIEFCDYLRTILSELTKKKWTYNEMYAHEGVCYSIKLTTDDGYEIDVSDYRAVMQPGFFTVLCKRESCNMCKWHSNINVGDIANHASVVGFLKQVISKCEGRRRACRSQRHKWGQ